MKLTRRDFLKGGAITALALAVGLKPKATGTTTCSHVGDTPFLGDVYAGEFTAEGAAPPICSNAHYGWPQDMPYHPSCLCILEPSLGDRLVVSCDGTSSVFEWRGAWTGMVADVAPNATVEIVAREA